MVETIKYCGGISSVLWRVLNTLEGYHQYCGEYYIQWRDIISSVESIEYCGGISSVLWRVLNTVEGYHQFCGEY